MPRRLAPEERAERERVKEEKRQLRLATRSESLLRKQEDQRVKDLLKAGLGCTNPNCKGFVKNASASGLTVQQFRQSERNGSELWCPDCGVKIYARLPSGMHRWFGAVISSELLQQYDAADPWTKVCDICDRQSIYPRHKNCAFLAARIGHDAAVSRMQPYTLARGESPNKLSGESEDGD